MNETEAKKTGICQRWSHRPSNESSKWLLPRQDVPLWSRRSHRIAAGSSCSPTLAKYKDFHVDIPGRLWSLWGNLHPDAAVFEKQVRGRQYLACCVMACCAASAYPLMDWNPHLLDTIVVSGSQYFKNSIKGIKKDYELSLENLDSKCVMDSLKFKVHIEHVAFGKLYRVPTVNKMNLSEALIFFFNHYQFGVLTVKRRALAIGFCPGQSGGYFMYDCQEMDFPLFPPQQGASYVLRTCNLQELLFHVVVTLNIPFPNISFSIHNVDVVCKKMA
ncbi:hypothetical protein KR074_010849 [Drosophila pseudoananassae]|nr:hypothetical protein KR074_010849 [Drosophila pseudoananassae]